MTFQLSQKPLKRVLAINKTSEQPSINKNISTDKCLFPSFVFPNTYYHISQNILMLFSLNWVYQYKKGISNRIEGHLWQTTAPKDDRTAMVADTTVH